MPSTVSYYHVVFTLPAAIGAVAFQNKAAVYDLLFRTAAEGSRQELRLAVFEPSPRGGRLALRAVTIPAGVVCDALVRAVLAALDVAAERGCATGLDRRHDLQLGEAHVTGVGLPPRRPVGAEDVGDLERGPRHAAVVRRAAFSSSG